MVTTSDSGPTQTVDLTPVAGANPQLRVADGQILVAQPGLGERRFAIGDGREQVALVTEYRTQVTLPQGVDVEYRGVLLRCLDGRAHAWLASTPADSQVYRSEDVAGFSQHAGLRHDDMRLDYSALLRIAAKAERFGEGTGQVSRFAEGLGRVGSAFIVLGTLFAFSGLAMGLIPHATDEPGPIAAVAVSFIVLVFGFSWLGIHLAGRSSARRGAPIWIAAAALALIVTVVCAVGGARLAGLGVLGTCLIPVGACLWLVGVPLLPWSLSAVAPRSPQPH